MTMRPPQKEQNMLVRPRGNPTSAPQLGHLAALSTCIETAIPLTVDKRIASVRKKKTGLTMFPSGQGAVGLLLLMELL